MKNSTSAGIIIALLLIAGGIYFFYWGIKNQNPQSPALPSNEAGNQPQTMVTVKTGSTANLGNFLTDGNGMTLYYFANDAANKSNCTGNCLIAWPVFYADAINVPDDLNKDDFQVVTRDGGQKQTTFKNRPLYYHSKDLKPGDTLGEGFDGIWFAAKIPFYTIVPANKTSTGIYITDAAGKALYVFADDTPGTATAKPKSACNSDCSKTWPPFYREMEIIITPSAINKADFTEFDRDDGTSQLAYKGYPLYYYSNDMNPGDTIGNGFNSVWHLASPAGFKTTGKTKPATSISTGVGGDYAAPSIADSGQTEITGGSAAPDIYNNFQLEGTGTMGITGQ